MTIQITNVDSSQDTDKYNETILLQPGKWVVYLSQTAESMSLFLVKLSSSLSQWFVFEAKQDNVAVLKMMEVKLREFLRGKHGFVRES